MSDFRTQFVSGTIPTASTSVTVPAPGGFTAVADFDRAFLLPACTMQTTAGIGRTSGTLNASLIKVTANVGLDDTDAITFAEGDQGTIARDDLCGAWLLEYVGPPTGPNAVINRGDVTLTLAAGITTIDSAPLQGVVNTAKCVPFATAYGTYNSFEYRAHFGTVDLVSTGGSFVVRVTRGLGNGSLVVRVRVAEFTGSNWTIQKVSHVFGAANTNEDVTISSAPTANSFTVSSFLPTGTTPQQQNHFVWLASATTLRHRLKTKPTSGPTVLTWVLSNPLLAVTRYGTPDGTNDITASGISPESQNITITAVPDLSQALAVGYMGADTTDTTGVMCGWWMGDLTSTTTLRVRRSQSIGDTEYVWQVVDFSGVVSARLDTVSALTDGAAFTITGLFGSSPTVTHGGDAVTVTGSSSTSISCTASLGTKRYGDPYDLIVRDASGGVVTTQVPIAPASGTRYTNLRAPLALAAQRLTTTSVDLIGTEQIRWKTADVTGTAMTSADVDVFANGVARVHPAVTGVKFSAHDGTGYGADGLQTFAAPVAVPVLNGTIPNFQFDINVPVQINVAQYGLNWTSLSLTGSLPTGLTHTNGIIVGSVASVTSALYSVSYTNSAGTTVSNNFTIAFVSATAVPTISGSQADASYSVGTGTATIDVRGHFTGATTYSILPTPPTGWSFSAGVLTVDLTQAIVAGPFVVTGSNVAGSVQLNPFTVTVAAIPQVAVPDLIGLTLANATTALTSIGLTVGAQQSDYSDTAAISLIYAQSPAAGTLVNQGTGVDISISLGPRPFIPPATALKPRRATKLRNFLLG